MCRNSSGLRGSTYPTNGNSSIGSGGGKTTEKCCWKNDILRSTWLLPLCFHHFFASQFFFSSPNRAHQKRQGMNCSTFGSNSPKNEYKYIHPCASERPKRVERKSKIEHQLDAIPILCFPFLSAT